MENIKEYDFKGNDYTLNKQSQQIIYTHLMDVASHLSSYYECDDLSPEENFISVLFSNNTKFDVISINKWLNIMDYEQKLDYCLGNEKIANLIDNAVKTSIKSVEYSQEQIQDLLENYLYTECYDYYSGQSNVKPKFEALPEKFVKENKETIKVALYNSILRNHLRKRQSNVDRMNNAIDSITSIKPLDDNQSSK